jgi:hypothetical protein
LKPPFFFFFFTTVVARVGGVDAGTVVVAGAVVLTNENANAPAGDSSAVVLPSPSTAAPLPMNEKAELPVEAASALSASDEGSTSSVLGVEMNPNALGAARPGGGR